jgi:2-hydroxy-3-oxopropionate reductase
MANIAFIGLGIMGSHMARNLIKGGHTLFVDGAWSVPEDLARQASVCPSTRAATEAAEVIIVMVPDTLDVNAVLFGENGVAASLSGGKLVIDMSSIAPLDTKAFAQRINRLGCDYLDAPVSGGEVGARDATLTIMVGGPEQAFEKARPLFELMGRHITLIGEYGAGQTC